jgi:hypothetical protein
MFVFDGCEGDGGKRISTVAKPPETGGLPPFSATTVEIVEMEMRFTTRGRRRARMRMRIYFSYSSISAEEREKEGRKPFFEWRSQWR